MRNIIEGPWWWTRERQREECIHRISNHSSSLSVCENILFLINPIFFHFYPRITISFVMKSDLLCVFSWHSSDLLTFGLIVCREVKGILLRIHRCCLCIKRNLDRRDLSLSFPTRFSSFRRCELCAFLKNSWLIDINDIKCLFLIIFLKE
jgi:hypothetical protein